MSDRHKLIDHYGGWIPQRPDHRDLSFNASERILLAHQLPGKVDLWPNVPPIWDQGQLGSCTAHGSLRTYLIEAKRQKLNAPMLSRLQQYFDARALEGTTDQDSGATVRDAIKALVQTGAGPESDWPYDTSKFAERPSAKAYRDAKQHMAVKYQSITLGGPGAPMRTALASGLAICFGFSVPSSFEDGSWDPASQVLPLPGPNDGFIGGHCVALTGYDFTCTRHPVPYFVADNSWGIWGGAWGGQGCTGGRFALDYRWFDRWSGLASDLWTIQSVSG